MINALPSEQQALVGIIDPDAYTAATYLTAAIDMSKFESIQAIVSVGDLGTNATVDAKLTASATSGGTYSDVTGKAITQLTQAGSDDNKQAIINLRGEELTEGLRFVKLSMTVATATSDAGAFVMGANPRVGPASDNDLSTVDEIVS